MRASLKIYFVTICSLILTTGLSFSQQFQTGFIADSLEQHGRLKFYAPNLSYEQINRTSVLVGTGLNAVFDFENNATPVINPMNVPLPEISDFEILGVIDNGVSAAHPYVTVRENIYGWAGTAYSLVKYTVTNNEENAVNAIIGIEIIPKIDGDFGDEIVEYISALETISIHKSADFVGYKWLSSDLTSLISFEYYLGYNAVDYNLWSWLNYGQFDEYFDPGPIGAVSIAAQGSVHLEPGDSTEVWFGMSYGYGFSSMLEALNDAEEMYSTLSVNDNSAGQAPLTFELMQNYPNPFNPETIISFSLESKQFVSMLIFNNAGEQIQTLVNAEKPAGLYNIYFNGGNLSSGIYYYLLKAGNQTSTRKMMLVK